MNDILVKFSGGQCSATSCGSENPITAMLANTMLQEMNTFTVVKTQDVQVQSVGDAMRSSGIALG